MRNRRRRRVQLCLYRPRRRAGRPRLGKVQEARAGNNMTFRAGVQHGLRGAGERKKSWGGEKKWRREHADTKMNPGAIRAATAPGLSLRDGFWRRDVLGGRDAGNARRVVTFFRFFWNRSRNWCLGREIRHVVLRDWLFFTRTPIQFVGKCLIRMVQIVEFQFLAGRCLLNNVDQS